jgi:hypothetical protein
MLISQRLRTQCASNFVAFNAIAGKQFSLLINPIIDMYQIIHISSGYHVSSFWLPQYALQCFLNLESEVKSQLFEVGSPHSYLLWQIKNIVTLWGVEECGGKNS